MANNLPSLQVYTPITGTSVFVEDVAGTPDNPIATGYQHSIKRLGGYWTANWTMALADIGPRMYDEWRTNRKFYHLVEQAAGDTTWEGSIEEIQADDDRGLLSVYAYGYVHGIQNRHNSTTDAGTTDADAWVEIMRSTDCEFIQSGSLSANTLQCYKAGTDKVWDEMMKVVELGDGTNKNPWRIGVYQDRRLYYEIESATPKYYVRGGMRWRIDMINDLINWTVVRYTDEAGTAQPDIAISLTESVNRYGRREERLERSNIPTASATVLAQAYVYEHAWPRMRAVGCGKNIQVYDSIGCNNALLPWKIQPGVYQDTSLPAGGGEYLSWLTDSSHFLVDEVVATEAGVQLRTSSWTELDALEAYYDYLADPSHEGEKKKKKKRKKK